MADQAREARQTSDIIQVMAELNRGDFLIECGRQLQEATDAVIRTGAKSKVTITLDILPAGMRDGRINQFEISPAVTIKEPQARQPSSLFFITEDGLLSRNDPDQEHFEFDKEQRKQNG